MKSAILENLGQWAAALRIQDIPPRVIEKIQLQILTGISAAAAAPWHEPSRAVLRARKSSGNALIFATLDRTAPSDAAFVNAAFAMSLDFDDYMLAGHTGYSAVLVPLAYARTLEEVIVAAAAANEIMGRLSTDCFIGPLNGQMSSYIHNIGAAVSLGKILDLPARRLTSAMAVALYQPNFCLIPGFFHEGTKTVTASMPLEQGISAANLAGAGLTGPAGLLEHHPGFFDFFSFAHFPGLYEGLGKVWFSDTLCYKRYPGTSYISAGVEAAIRAGKGLKPEDITAVRVETTFLSSTLDRLGASVIERSPMDANAVNFSLRLSIAAALCFGDLTPAGLHPETLKAEDNHIREIARRITIIHDWNQTLEMIGASPVGLAVFARLRPWQWIRLIRHSRALNRGPGKSPKSIHFWRGMRRKLPLLMEQIKRARKTSVSAFQMELETFRMLQSAKVTVSAGNTHITETVDIPLGACGRNFEETRDLVRWRCAAAFGDRGDKIFEVVFTPQSRVEALYQAILDK